jgi:hypothetical protein
MQKIKIKYNNKTCIDKHLLSPKIGIWCSIAPSFNYVSPSPQDEDAFLHCLMVSIKSFFSIALLSGNVIFYNPLHHHCISQCAQEYLDEEVFVSSSYKKPEQLGGNNNHGQI